METNEEKIEKLNETISDYRKGQKIMQTILSSEIDLKKVYKKKLDDIKEIIDQCQDDNCKKGKCKFYKFYDCQDERLFQIKQILEEKINER